MIYKLTRDGIILKINGESISYIPENPANSDYQDYLQWLAAGNTPEPPDPLPEPVKPRPSIEDRLEAVELIVDLGLMEGLL
jgi:hypothetical protein